MINTRREGRLMRNSTMSISQTTISSRRSRITIAVLIGVLLGCVFAFYFPHCFFGFRPLVSLSRIAAHSDPQVASGKCESSKKINFLKVEFALAFETNAALKKQIKDLTEKLQSVEQIEDQVPKQVFVLDEQPDQVPKQVFVLDEQPKSGPFGTVKGLRTNPTVPPDESINPKLAKILNKVAIHQELIVTLASSNDKNILEFWFKNIKRVGIPNYLVIALDKEIADFCQQNGVPVYKRSYPNAVSGFKFNILREFLQLGYNVLFSDINIIYLQNPFMHLHRDSDIESMSDGHDNMTSYGYDDVYDEPSMGWARYAHTIRIWVYNIGFFYIRATIPSIELLDRVSWRLSREPNSWDQAVFNEELFHPSYPGYNGLYASKRTMDFFLFMNSKVLFKTVRKNSRLSMSKPVIVNVNYHPDKLSRLKGIEEYYIKGQDDALDRFPGGSEW